MDDRSVSLNYYLSKEYRDPPKAFWKYYDLYRRKQITFKNIGRLREIKEQICLRDSKSQEE